MAATAPAPPAGKQLPVWFALPVVWLIVGVSMGRSQSMGLFQIPIVEAIGIGRADYSLSLALTFLMMGVGAPITGAMIDKYGLVFILLCYSTALVIRIVRMTVSVFTGGGGGAA